MSADPSGAHDDARLRADLAGNLADDPLHQRLERDQPGGAAVLVDDERLAHARRRISASRSSAPSVSARSAPRARARRR